MLIILASFIFPTSWKLVSLFIFLALLAVNYVASKSIAASDRGTARLLLGLSTVPSSPPALLS